MNTSTTTRTNAMNDTLTREQIMGLLTDEEVAKVSTAEGAPRLIEGDEYVDLEDVRAGIQQVQATPRTAPAATLARSSVSDATWLEIVRAVAS
jgi:thiamine biosynthesis protein ThiC